MTYAILVSHQHLPVGRRRSGWLFGLAFAEELPHVCNVELLHEEMQEEALHLGLAFEDLLAEEADLQRQPNDFLPIRILGDVLQAGGDMLVDDGLLLSDFVHHINCQIIISHILTFLSCIQKSNTLNRQSPPTNNCTSVGNHNLNSMINAASVTPSTAPTNDIETLRKENNDLIAKLANSEQQRIVAQKKVEILEVELAKAIKESHGLVLTIEKERTEQLALIQTTENLRNEHNLHDAETHKFQTLSKTLGEENKTLKAELEAIKLEKVALLKEKQNASNKLLLVETKLEASSMQETFFNATLVSLTTENQRLREETETLGRKLRENSSGYVKTVLKDNNQTTKQLLSEFEEKIHSKEMANMEEKQRYETRISELNRKVAQLESQLASR